MIKIGGRHNGVRVAVTTHMDHITYYDEKTETNKTQNQKITEVMELDFNLSQYEMVRQRVERDGEVAEYEVKATPEQRVMQFMMDYSQSMKMLGVSYATHKMEIKAT